MERSEALAVLRSAAKSWANFLEENLQFGTDDDEQCKREIAAIDDALDALPREEREA